GRELLAVLDAEIERLSETDRAPLVLCCFDGLSIDEAATRLGVTPGAVKGRLERSRERLRRNLARRGFVVPAVLGSGLLFVSSTAVAQSLVESTTSICLGSTTIPSTVATIVGTAPRFRIGLAMLAGVTCIGVGLLVARSPTPPPANN